MPDDETYRWRGRFDDDTRLWSIEILTPSGGFYRILGLDPLERSCFIDELERAPDDWDSVLRRWSLGYRPTKGYPN